MPPKIAVVITHYNNDRTLKDCVTSAVNCGWSNLDVIVVDDGSSRDPTPLINEYLEAGSARLIRQRNRGLGSARATGAQNTDAEFLSFLDADDCIFPGKLDQQLEAISDNPLDTIVFTGTKLYQNGEPIGDKNCSARRSELTIDITERFVQGKVRPASATMLLSSEIYEKIGGFDPTIRRQCEFDFFCRAISQNVQLALVVLPLYRQNLSLTSNRHRTSYRLESIELIISRLKTLLESDLESGARKRLSAYAHFKCRMLWYASLEWDKAARRSLMQMFGAANFLQLQYRLLFKGAAFIPSGFGRILRGGFRVGQRLLSSIE